MSKKFYWVLLIPFSMLMFACKNSNSDNANNDTSATAKLEQAGDNIKDAANTAVQEAKQAMSPNDDSQFVVKAMNQNENEIMLLEAGAKMGNSKDVKSHAKMMLADHNALEKKLDAYSKAKNYPVAIKDKASDKLDDMKDKKGVDWDRAWWDKMEDGHKDAIKTFENARNDVKDAELKAMIDNTLPTLHKHLDMVTEMKEKMR
jgi:putative membrane protein